MIGTQRSDEDTRSRTHGIGPHANYADIFPSVIKSVGISAGSPWSKIFDPYGMGDDRQITLSGVTEMATSAAMTSYMQRLFNNLGAWLVPTTSMPLPANTVSIQPFVFNTADGGTISAVDPVLIGWTLQPVSMAGAMYLNSTLNIAAAQCGSAPGVLTEEKTAAGNTPTMISTSEQFSLDITFQTMHLGLGGQVTDTVKFGSSESTVAADGTNKPIRTASFVVTQVSASVSTPSMDSVAAFLPYGLEAWAINPLPGITPGYETEMGMITPPPGGHPLSMGEEVMRRSEATGGETGYTPQLAEFGCTNQYAAGWWNSTRYWQVAAVADAPLFTVSLSFSGFFIDPVKARAMFDMLQPIAGGKGRLTVRNPDLAPNARVLLDRYGARLASHTLDQDTTTFGGKPAIASTITFEVPSYDYGPAIYTSA